MKYFFVAAVVCFSAVVADVKITDLQTGARQDASASTSAPVVEVAVPEVTVPSVVAETTVAAPSTCSNVTVDTKDCGSVIVTRLPFLFNFRYLSGICNCEDGQLKCDRGAGSSFYQRFQIPALRVVYNANCKCKCPSTYAVEVEGADTVAENQV